MCFVTNLTKGEIVSAKDYIPSVLSNLWCQNHYYTTCYITGYVKFSQEINIDEQATLTTCIALKKKDSLKITFEFSQDKIQAYKNSRSLQATQEKMQDFFKLELHLLKTFSSLNYYKTSRSLVLSFNVPTLVLGLIDHRLTLEVGHFGYIIHIYILHMYRPFLDLV